MNKVEKIFICWGIIVAVGPILLALVIGTMSDNVQDVDFSSLIFVLILEVPANVLIYVGIPYARCLLSISSFCSLQCASSMLP